MIPASVKFYLASQSPRRRKLMSLLSNNFSAFSVDLDEVIYPDEDPEDVVLRLAEHKMDLAIQQAGEGIVITGDTIVVLDDEILVKPVDEEDAFHILSKLSDQSHSVYTGYSVHNKVTGKRISRFERTEVYFRKLSEHEIRDYIRGGSPMDKAGAYGIQDDYGAVFVRKIEGCYYNVVGFPLSAIYLAIKEII
ncbi:MAG: Maf-like protein [Melioribacteraceae bacterium]|nr:MAG: Maf-like protein [Melioribacteraceae bacterium]